MTHHTELTTSYFVHFIFATLFALVTPKVVKKRGKVAVWRSHNINNLIYTFDLPKTISRPPQHFLLDLKQKKKSNLHETPLFSSYGKGHCNIVARQIGFLIEHRERELHIGVHTGLNRICPQSSIVITHNNEQISESAHSVTYNYHCQLRCTHTKERTPAHTIVRVLHNNSGYYSHLSRHSVYSAHAHCLPNHTLHTQFKYAYPVLYTTAACI